jgi:hypothetical protein
MRPKQKRHERNFQILRTRGLFREKLLAEETGLKRPSGMEFPHSFETPGTKEITSGASLSILRRFVGEVDNSVDWEENDLDSC